MIEVTAERVAAFNGADFSGCGNADWEDSHVRAGLTPVLADVEREHVRPLLELIQDLADPDECWYDHHGYCQAHSWFEVDPRCPHARAREALKEAGLKP